MIVYVDMLVMDGHSHSHGTAGSGKGEECHDIIFNHADKSPEW